MFDGFVARYDSSEGIDGLPTGEGAFLPCSFWLADALDMLGELKESGDASEDDVERAKKKAEELVAEAGQGVDKMVAQKEKEILAI